MRYLTFLLRSTSKLFAPSTLLLAIAASPLLAENSLQHSLENILAAPALKGGITGAIVCRVEDGKVIFEQNADIRLLPASNRKLFTSAAALELLGDNFQISTDICATSKPDATGHLQGDLYLRGGGDGLLSPEDLEMMAKTLAKAGVADITGDLVGDATRFTDGPYGFGWEWDDFSDEEFPQIAGLEVNEGVLNVHLTTGAAIGDPVTAALQPATDYLPVDVKAKTSAKDSFKSCTVSRPWGKNEFLVEGNLPLGSTFDVRVPVDSPPLLAITLLRDDLAKQGITIHGRLRLGMMPTDPIVLASHASLPLSQYLAKMNKPSDNLLAESLIRLLDSHGTYDAGHLRETPFFKSLGVDVDSIALVDGCGVGRRNFVTARAVSQLLIGMNRKADWRFYYDSLPIMGVDGTLKNRLVGKAAAGNVHAKTGTLSQVRALSGYFTGRGKKLYIFSLLMNNFPGTAHAAGDVQDRFVERLVESL